MGGIGSGLPSSGKRTVEGCYVIDATELARRSGLGGRCVGRPAPVYIPEPAPEEMYAVFVSDAEGWGGTLEMSYTVRLGGGRWAPGKQKIAVSTTPVTYGGVRQWFHCPLRKEGRRCSRRCRILYLPRNAREFGCRQCHSLMYQSQRLSQLDRILRRINLLEQQLGWDSDTERQRRPKGMHRRTYHRLCEEYEQAEDASLSSLDPWIKRLPVPKGAG